MDYSIILYMLGSALTGAGAFFGVSKIVEMLATRRFAKADKKQVVHETNEGKLIDADQLALKLLHDDFVALKAEVKNLTEQLEKVKDERADLRAENKILRNTETLLKERIDRQGQRIQKLEEDVSLTNTLLSEAKAATVKREAEISVLRGELNLAVQAMNEFKREHALGEV